MIFPSPFHNFIVFPNGLEKLILLNFVWETQENIISDDIPEVNVGNTFVWFMHHTYTNIPVLLVLAVQGVPHHIVTGFRMKWTDTENFVTWPLWRRSTRGTASHRRPSSIPHIVDQLVVVTLMFRSSTDVAMTSGLAVTDARITSLPKITWIVINNRSRCYVNQFLLSGHNKDQKLSVTIEISQ